MGPLWHKYYQHLNNDDLISAKIIPYFLQENVCSRADDVIDLAIIGAGITGSFSAWRLRNNFSKISLFEYSDRIGGKIFTARLSDGIKVELGAMRVYQKRHSLIMKLLNETNMTTVPFSAVHPLDTRAWYLRRTRKRRNETITTSTFPYQVPPEEMNRTYIDLMRFIINNKY